jgi:rubrerythrin
MSKYFDNANTQVTRNKFGSNFGRKITNKNLIPVKQRDKVDKQEVMMEARKKYMDINNQAQRKQIDKLKNQREFRKVINESYEKLKNDLFCNILHHICLEALTIDEEPMYENMEQITDSINEQFKSIGGLDVLKEQAKTSNNELIKRMIAVCENTAKKVADRNLKECDSADEFKFELNDEEKDDFDYNKDSINIDAISNKIKDKIIKVVTDEKKANTKKTEIMDEIKDKLDEDEVEDEAATEAMEFIFNQKIETTTLFEALMRDCYKITLETPEKTFYGSYVKENSEEDDTEYKFKDLDKFEDNNVITDEEIVDDLMISESFSNQLPINDLEKLETMISESVKLRSTPGNLGFYSDYDTGVSDIIKSAKENEHIAEVILQPGFRENIMNLIKVAKHGPDVAYINQLAKLPFRIFGRKGRAVKVLENYETWLNNEYKDLYLETLNNLGISLKNIPEFRQQLLSYKPVSDVFIENAEGILEAVTDSDYNEMDSKLKNTSDKLKKVAEDCGKNKKDLSSCKESIREIQKSTEELKDNSKNSKSCAEVCSAKAISKNKDDLAEMLVCPECGKDPCICEDSSVCPKCGKNPCKCENSSVIESDDIDSDNDAEDEDYKKYLDEDDDDIDFIEEGKQYRCMSCGYIAEDEAPEYCPKCGNDADQFKLMEGFAKNYINNMKNLPKAIKGISKDAYKVTGRNIGTIMINGIKAKGDINKTHKGLLKIVNKCKSVKEVEYLQKDLASAKVTMKTKINKAKNDEEKEALKQHLKWLSTEYSKALTEKKKQIKTAVKEQADFEQDFLYGKDRALYSIKESKNTILDIPKPSNMRKYCLLKKINEATSFNDLKDVKEYIMEEMSVYKANKEYVSWLRDTLDNTVELKHNVLEEQVLIDRFVNQLDEICESIDLELDKHDEAKQIALESMYTTFHGDRVFAPIFKTNDVNSNNMEFAYKLKFVCEGLKGLTKDCQNDVELAQAERLISRNINTIESLMESLEDSGCYQYKLNTLNTAKKYLEKLSSHIPALKDKYVMESLDYEYDEELITEAVELTDEVYENAMSEDVLYNTKNELMDVVMAEAITKYTIMETFNTLKLTNLNHDDIEKIVRDIVK